MRIRRSIQYSCFLTVHIICQAVQAQNIDLRHNFSDPQRKDTLENGLVFIQLKDSVTIDYVKYLHYCSVLSQTPEALSYENIQAFCDVGMYRQVDSFYDRKDQEILQDGRSLFKDTVSQQDLHSLDSLLIQNREQKVVMLNDLHSRMETRAFFLSKLALFRKLGYTHLAMEAFQHLSENKPDFNLGFFFQEPIMAEIYRQAKKLGFKLVHYDYGNNTNDPGHRDSMMAFHLYQQIRKLSSNEKMLVFAGMSHMAEDIPMKLDIMGSVLKTQFKIDPLTIDLTRGVIHPAASDIVLLPCEPLSKGGVYIPTKMKAKYGFTFMDYFYMFPAYKYVNGRPDWLACGGVRHPYAYKCQVPKTVLIQAYYASETNLPEDYRLVTPADMVYELDKNKYAHFYLVPGLAYHIIFRDENNHIIKKETFYANKK